MGLRINTNVQSLVAQRNLGISSSQQKNSIEKLASGSRINRSADDAAGLAVSENMTATIRSVRQGIRNAHDGISMIQTAEGAMNEVSNILIRFRELSMQAASDTLGDTERGFIDKEVQQLKGEIERISAATEFNGHKLLNGAGEKLDLQVGHNNNPEYDRFTYDTSKTDVSVSRLGIDGMSVADKVSAQENLGKIDTAIKTVAENRAELGAFQNRIQSAVNSLQVYDENMQSARSQIRDVDMASETAELTRNNIISQAGISVLSQANNNSMYALKLLG